MPKQLQCHQRYRAIRNESVGMVEVTVTDMFHLWESKKGRQSPMQRREMENRGNGV